MIHHWTKLRLQMSLHRLLQRGFASLFGYKEKLALSETDLSEYSSAILVATSMSDLHFKMKGARCLAKTYCNGMTSRCELLNIMVASSRNSWIF